jgi:hypothetical protein
MKLITPASRPPWWWWWGGGGAGKGKPSLSKKGKPRLQKQTAFSALRLYVQRLQGTRNVEIVSITAGSSAILFRDPNDNRNSRTVR